MTLPASQRFTSLGRPAALSQRELDEITRWHHPYVAGLFAELPEPFTDFSNQDDWLRVARLMLPQVYRSLDAAPGFAATSTLGEGFPEGNDGDTGAVLAPERNPLLRVERPQDPDSGVS